MRIRVLFFAVARDAAGREAADLDLPAGATVADARRAIGEAFPALEPLLRSWSIAVDLEYARPETPVPDGAEVAVIPPVSGG